MNRFFTAFLIFFAGLSYLAPAQITKLPGAMDLYLAQPIQKNGIREVSVVLRQAESEGSIPLILNKYNAKGQLVDSTDQTGDLHHFTYAANGKMSQYLFTSTSFEYEKMTGLPEYRQSKEFIYDAKGHLITLKYYQLDSLSHTIDFTLDKKGRTVAYHGRDQFNEPSFMGYYTYTKFDSVLSFVDYTADSTPILTIDYTYNKKKKPIHRVEKTPGTPAITEWTYVQTATGDSTIMTIVEPGNNEAGMEILRMTRQTLSREMAKKRISKTQWQYYAIEYPEAEMQDAPEPKLLDSMTGIYDGSGKPLEMLIAADGAPVKSGKIIYDSKGLIDYIEITNTETGEKELTVDYTYVFF